MREYARIQSFPNEYMFYSSVASKYRQIGNAVPVRLGYHTGINLVKLFGINLVKLLENIKEEEV